MKIAATLLISCACVLGQSVTQEYAFSFTNVPLWDITGGYERSENFEVVTGFFSLHADGKLTGTRMDTYDHNGDYLEGSAFITGRLWAAAGEVKYRDSWEGSYSGTIGGKSIMARASTHGTGLLIADTLSLQLSASARFCVVGGSCSTTTQAYSLHLPAGMDGTWDLSMVISTNGTKIIGQSTLTLSTGRAFDYEVTGTQNLRRNTSVIRLKGVGEAMKSSFTLYTTNGQQMLTKIQGRLLGQKLQSP